MNLFGKDLERDVVVVAEIGNNHEGSFSLAEEMIGQAAETGVDAVKFQTFRPENLVSGKNQERMARLKKFQLKEEDFKKLKSFADSKEIHFFSTPLDLASAEFLNTLCDVFKIASGDNTFYPLIERVASFKKPILLSTGVADLSAIAEAKKRIEAVWKKSGFPSSLVLLHCVSSYPAPLSEANLSAISALRKSFGNIVGYSDHTIGIEAAVLSVAAGARVIEKHFTLNKQQSNFRDHQLSATPAEFKELVRRVREANTLLGNGLKVPQPSEKANATEMRRSIAASRDLSSGTVLSLEDLTWVRPGEGLPPGQESKVTGRRLKCSLKIGDIISLDMLE